MRIYTFIFLAAFSLSAVGADMEEGVDIGQYNGQYSISYFNHKDDVLSYFESKGLQGGGYTWEALVRAALEIEAPEQLARLESDPEADAFYAYAPTESVANTVKGVLEKLSADIQYRERCIERAIQNGYIE